MLVHCDLQDILAVTLVQYIKCSINYPSSSLLWCKYRIIRQLIKHRLKSLYIYCIWKRISWTLLRLVLDKFTANANTTRRHILQPLTELSHLFLPTVPFLSGHKIPLVSREPYSTLSRQPKIGRKNYALRHRSCFDVWDKPLKGWEKNVVKP